MNEKCSVCGKGATIQITDLYRDAVSQKIIEVDGQSVWYCSDHVPQGPQPLSVNNNNADNKLNIKYWIFL